MHKYLQRAIKIDELVQDNTLEDYFPLHDQFVLKGKLKISLFVNLLDKPQDVPLGATKKQPKRFLDVSKLISPDYKYQDKKVQEFIQVIQENADPSDFLRKPLSEQVQINWKFPWHIPIPPIRDYFGEKIALYFSFLSYYTSWKSVMALTGLVCYIIQD